MSIERVSYAYIRVEVEWQIHLLALRVKDHHSKMIVVEKVSGKISEIHDYLCSLQRL